jgi:hypothetical protein
VTALKFQQEVKVPSLEIQALLLQIYSSNTTIPVIILDKDGQIIEHKNIPQDIENNSAEIVAWLTKWLKIIRRSK